MKQEEIMVAFAKNLKRYRKACGLKQADFASLIGYSSKAVSKWERGQGMPAASLLPVIASALHTDIDSLMRVQQDIAYYLGVDGGGTKTEFCLTDTEGKTIASCVLGGSNPNDVGFENSCAILRDGAARVCGTIPYSRISVFAGIAGASSGNYGKNLTKYLRTMGFASAVCDSDAKNAIAAALGNRNGMITIMGTGNVTFVQKDGKLQKVGGFNYLFDEGGSGFTVGRAAIAYALRAEERGESATMLYKLVLEKCGTGKVLDRLTDFYTGGKRSVADFAPLVFEAHAAGDGTATRILEENAAVVADQLNFGATLLAEECPKAVLVGGLTQKADVLLPMIKEKLNGNFELSAFTGSPVLGALRLAGLEDQSC